MNTALRSLTLAGLVFVASGSAFAQHGAAKPAAATDSITLKPKVSKGDVMKFNYHVERSESINVPQAQAGGTPTLSVTMDAAVTATFRDVNDAGMAIDIVFGTVKATGKPPMGEPSTFDSSKPEDDKDRDNPAYLAFKPAVGMKLTLMTDVDGVVVEIVGDPISPEGTFKAVAIQALVNKDYTRFRWTAALSALRGKGPIKIGDTWKNVDTFTAPPVGQLQHTFTHTLKTVHDGTADVDSVGEMTLLPLKEGDKPAFALSDTTMLATSKWDLKDGVSRSLEMQRNFTLTGSAQGLNNLTRIVQEKFILSRDK